MKAILLLTIFYVVPRSFVLSIDLVPNTPPQLKRKTVCFAVPEEGATQKALCTKKVQASAERKLFELVNRQLQNQCEILREINPIIQQVQGQAFLKTASLQKNTKKWLQIFCDLQKEQNTTLPFSGWLTMLQASICELTNEYVQMPSFLNETIPFSKKKFFKAKWESVRNVVTVFQRVWAAARERQQQVSIQHIQEQVAQEIIKQCIYAKQELQRQQANLSLFSSALSQLYDLWEDIYSMWQLEGKEDCCLSAHQIVALKEKAALLTSQLQKQTQSRHDLQESEKKWGHDFLQLFPEIMERQIKWVTLYLRRVLEEKEAPILSKEEMKRVFLLPAAEDVLWDEYSPAVSLPEYTKRVLFYAQAHWNAWAEPAETALLT